MLVMVAAYFAALSLFASYEAGLARQTGERAAYFSDRIDAENTCFFADSYALDGLMTISKSLEIDGTKYAAAGREIVVMRPQGAGANATCLARVQTGQQLQVGREVWEIR